MYREDLLSSRLWYKRYSSFLSLSFSFVGNLTIEIKVFSSCKWQQWNYYSKETKVTHQYNFTSRDRIINVEFQQQLYSQSRFKCKNEIFFMKNQSSLLTCLWIDTRRCTLILLSQLTFASPHCIFNPLRTESRKSERCCGRKVLARAVEKIYMLIVCVIKTKTLFKYNKILWKSF